MGNDNGKSMGNSMKATRERELKFKFPPGFQLPVLPGQTCQRRILTSTYYDTTDHQLGRLGITLRRRVEQSKGLWQLKLPSGTARLELEIPGGPGKLPSEFRNLLFALQSKGELIPLAKLRTERLRFLVRRDEKTLAEITRDSVVLLDGRRIRRRFVEGEVELMEGNEHDLQWIQHTLQDAGAQVGDSRPKLFKALDLAYPEILPQVDPAAPPQDHMKAMLEQQVREIRLYDPGTRLGKDPENLHQMRVATRRFRSILRAARPMLIPEWAQTLRSELAWLGGILGAVRDLDVLLEDLQHEAISLGPSEQKVFELLLRSFDSQRSILQNSLLEGLRSDRYLQLLNRIEKASIQPPFVDTHVMLQEIAAKEFRKLRKALKHLTPHSSDEDLHRLRIRTKRARYAAELAERSVGKPASRFIHEIKAFQTLLGKHQDAVMAEQRLRERIRSSRSISTGLAVGQVIERLRTRRQQAREALPKFLGKLQKKGKKAWHLNGGA